MLHKLQPKTPFILAASLILTMAFISCGDDDADLKPNTLNTPKTEVPADTVSNPDPESPSVFRLLTSHPWVLDETFEDGVQTQSNGTGLYEYTTSGEFKFETATQGWMTIGHYLIEGDSTSMYLELTGTPIMYVTIDKLDENDLHTSFSRGGKDFKYNYRKQ